jgi:hypothetical protein
MTSTYETTSHTNAADWVMDAVRRKPEALLLMAAGCALMMRRGRSSSEARLVHRTSEPGRARVGEAISDIDDRVSDTMSQTADRVSRYASDVKDRVSEAASSYASTASDYAEQAQHRMSEGTARMSAQARSAAMQASDTVRQQPLLIAALGLAAGAAVASFFPPTEVERRTLGSARQSLGEAATRVGENLVQAATTAAQQLKEDATRRGLSPEGLKEMASDAAETFTTTASGAREQDRSPAMSDRTYPVGSKFAG